MKVEESVNTIKISETPGCLWILGVFFVVIAGILLWGTLGGFSNWNEIETWELIATFIICVIGIAAGVWVISGGPITRVVIDRLENTVSVNKYGFFGKRSSLYRFEEVSHFCLIEDKDSDDLPIWSIGIRLTSGETIPITAMAIHAEELQQGYVFQFNEYMRKEMPSHKQYLELDE
ncbi:MAG: hypothetical protein KDB79_00960 [Acidobacteria bacterium]|nr:hypothetical protein [Acidobacteriota bacterium]